jgi:hypothetical protein
VSDATDPDAATDASEERRRLQRAVRAVRREGWKAAVVYGVVDGSLALLLVNLGLSVAAVDLPDVAGLSGQAVVSLAVGLLVAVGEIAVRTRQPLVERFEAVNPGVAEALRTARDAAADGADGVMARRLYADVLARLREASSRGLLDGRRLGATLVVTLVVGALTVQAAVVGVSLTDPPGTDPGGNGGPRTVGTPSDGYDGLRDGDAILGEPENVTRGDQNESAAIGGQAGGDEPNDRQLDTSYETGGFASGDAYDAQRAAFDEADEVENADIIREYNLRIRDTGDDDDD